MGAEAASCTVLLRLQNRIRELLPFLPRLACSCTARSNVRISEDVSWAIQQEPCSREPTVRASNNDNSFDFLFLNSFADL